LLQYSLPERLKAGLIEGLNGRAEGPAQPKSFSLKGLPCNLAFGNAIAAHFNMTLRFVYIERKEQIARRLRLLGMRRRKRFAFMGRK
jgi:hypothetical protein